MRKLMQALIISGVFNIVLASLFFYWVVKERPPTPYFESKPAGKEDQQTPVALDQSNAEVIRQFKELSLEQLIAKLASTDLVENGYTQRDLALACLVTFHHFDLTRSLIGLAEPAQHRAIQFGVRKDGTPSKVVAYPGLTDEQFKAISDFAQRERWPLTSRGLFVNLRKPEGRSDASLVDAFSLTPEYLAVEILLNRSEVTVERNDILNILNDGTWQMLSTFMEQQKEVQDLSPARRQHFLLQYIEKGSKAAAYVMLNTDGPVAVRKLDDMHVKAMLNLLTERTPQAEKFALALLTSPRGDSVWQLAALRLYQYAGETPPENFQHHEALARFLSKKTAIQKKLPAPIAIANAAKPIVAAAPSPKPTVANPPKPAKPAAKPTAPIVHKEPVKKKELLYIVQEGDSLWKISRRFKVDMDKLKSYNHMSSDNLKPGTSLRIPA